jgi:DNA-binding protein HU-beta
MPGFHQPKDTLMNKTDLITAVAEKSELSKTVTARALDAMLDTISAELKQGGTVQLIGFGSFTTRKREARTGRNPKTGEAMEIAASTAPVFKPGAKLKEAVQE